MWLPEQCLQITLAWHAFLVGIEIFECFTKYLEQIFENRNIINTKFWYKNIIFPPSLP